MIRDVDERLEQLSRVLQRAIDQLLFAESMHTCMESVCDPILTEIREAQARVAALRLRLEAVRDG
jgi:hypothetical protein